MCLGCCEDRYLQTQSEKWVDYPPDGVQILWMHLTSAYFASPPNSPLISSSRPLRLERPWVLEKITFFTEITSAKTGNATSRHGSTNPAASSAGETHAGPRPQPLACAHSLSSAQSCADRRCGTTTRHAKAVVSLSAS